MKILLSFLTLSIATLGAIGQPAWSKPAAAPAAAKSSSATSSSPLLRGVTFSPEQRAKIAAIQTKMNNKMVALLTPAQKETMRKSGAGSVQLTDTQKTQFRQIIASANAEIEGVLTPAQIKQIKANIQAQQNSQQPAGRR
jgi:ribosomal protein S11